MRRMAGQADSWALAVDRPDALGRGGRRHPPVFLASPPRRTSEVEGEFAAVKGPMPAEAGWKKGGSRWPGAATSAYKAEATPRLRGAKAHEMGLRSRGQRRCSGSPLVGRGA